MKKILLIAIICLLTLSVHAQKTTASQKDYEFILMSKPSLSQEYPNNKRIPEGGGTYHSFSFDGNYAFIYNEKHCGYYDVPYELRSGFRSSVKDLQRENSTLYWKRVKEVMADIDKYWQEISSKVSLVEPGGISTPHRVTLYKDDPQKDVFDVVEQMPSFPGGMGSLMRYLSRNVKYPVEAEENGIQGSVITTFIVEKDGSISEVEVKKSVFPALDAEAVRVVKAMPKWNPGKQNGKPVRVQYTIPVSFRFL